MTEKELISKIDSKQGAEIFTELYGEREIDAARQRYKTLVSNMTKSGQDGFPETERCDAAGNLRIFSAPGRTELGGNHTDHNRGKVLAASIQLDNVAIVQERGDNAVFFRSTGHPDVKVKLIDSTLASDLLPKPEEEGATESLVRGIAAELNRRGLVAGGFSANADSAVFPGSGLSSSAAVEVLLGRIFDSLYGKGKLSPLKIAQIGQIAENTYFGKPCGLMDQTACATGGAIAIDFAEDARPVVKRINFDLAALGYVLCVTNTGGSHVDLTADYASIPAEMKGVAAFFGKSVLRELEKKTVLSSASEIRKSLGDRAMLRALHFFDENDRVDAMTAAIVEMDKAPAVAKSQALFDYLELVNESGDSSWELLQNVYSRSHEQGISVALALSKDFFRRNKLRGAARVHGGGFAGVIQAYVSIDAMDAYRAALESVFGAGSVTLLRIRPRGAEELFL
jgi:galactokinase